MIRLTEKNEMELEQFERRIKKQFYARGVHIEYHIGCFGDEVHHTKLGALMWKLHELGLVRLHQKLIGENKHQYLGVVA